MPSPSIEPGSPHHVPYRGPHRGTLVLVLGIVSLIACALCGPFAWLMGRDDLRKMDHGLMDPEGRGLTQAGMICGIIGTILLVLPVIAIMVWLLLMVILAIVAAIAGGAV